MEKLRQRVEALEEKLEAVHKELTLLNNRIQKMFTFAQEKMRFELKNLEDSNEYCAEVQKMINDVLNTKDTL